LIFLAYFFLLFNVYEAGFKATFNLGFKHVG
jgi:hypothetical protein